MAFQDLAEFLSAGLELPYAGKTYTIPPIDAATGLWCQQLLNLGVRVVGGKLVTDEDAAGTELLDDDGEQTLYLRLLGAVHDEMVADGVPWAVVKIAALTVLFDATTGRDTAERYWNTGGAGRGEAPAPANRAARRTRATTPGTSAGATTTKRRASTTGTSASKATPQKATPSRGGRSSRTGA